ncbi:MAG: hypothetical protein LBR38_03270 [Synergistaceae bacterium]|jgi:hypothetical protein|nr:hypothetical protein [Synergistaceae bacterium]
MKKLCAFLLAAAMAFLVLSAVPASADRGWDRGGWDRGPRGDRGYWDDRYRHYPPRPLPPRYYAPRYHYHRYYDQGGPGLWLYIPFR